MKSSSNEFGTIALTTNARYYAKVVACDNTLTNQTLDEFKHVSYENPDGDISLGNTCASTVSFKLYKPSVVLENKEITIYQGLLINNAYEYLKLGIFKITKQTSDGEYTSYEGTDRMSSKMDMPYFSDLTFPNDDAHILQEICDQVGIQFATNVTSPNSVTIKPEGYTKREVIGYMAALQGKNAVINADGNLELRWYTDHNYEIKQNRLYQDEPTFTTSKNFVLNLLTCTVGSSNNTTTLRSGDGATGITFTNPFMTQAILDSIYQKIGGFTFRPMTVKYVGDFRVEVGDTVSVVKDGITYTVPVMQITNECDGGLISTIASVSKSDTTNSSSAQSGPLTKTMDRYYAELVLVNQALVNKLSVDTAHITYATIDELTATNARIDSIVGTDITVEYLEAHYAQIDLANIAAGTIKTAMIDTGAVKTAQIADGSITDAKIVSLTANKLSAGTIDASQIEVTNLNCANLTVGTINGTQIASNAIDISKLDSALSATITSTAADVATALQEAGVATETANTAKSAVDGMEIGGTNVLLNSKNLLNERYFFIDYTFEDESENDLTDENGNLLCA